jgi:hypothetical protein
LHFEELPSTYCISAYIRVAVSGIPTPFLYLSSGMMKNQRWRKSEEFISKYQDVR